MSIRQDICEMRGQLADAKRAYRRAIDRCDYDDADLAADEIAQCESTLAGLQTQLVNLRSRAAPYRNGPVTVIRPS